MVSREYKWQLSEWFTRSKDVIFKDESRCVIRTLEGDMTCLEGDYIIQGVIGEIYPCRSDIFEETYEVVQ